MDVDGGATLGRLDDVAQQLLDGYVLGAAVTQLDEQRAHLRQRSPVQAPQFLQSLTRPLGIIDSREGLRLHGRGEEGLGHGIVEIPRQSIPLRLRRLLDLALAQRRLGALALGHVTVGLQHARDAILAADELLPRQDDDLPAVAGDVRDLTLPGALRMQARPDLLPGQRVDGLEQLVGSPAHGLTRAEPVELLRATVPGLDGAVQLPEQDRVERKPKQVRLAPEALLGTLASADVTGEHERCARLAGQDDGIHLDRKTLAVLEDAGQLLALSPAPTAF